MMLRPKTWLAAARAAAGYSAPLLPFASFPAALTVEGQIRRPEELPHVSLIALGGLWRPLGGRQVLASRYVNPVTAQDLTPNALVEAIGPFPGGLVRGGMAVSLLIGFSLPAISTSLRSIRPALGNVSDTTPNIGYFGSSVNSLNIHGEITGKVIVSQDVGGTHFGTPSSGAGATGVAGGYGANNVLNNNSTDFSQDWAAAIRCQSIAENAITITGASWSAGVATYTTSANHTLAVGDKDVISGITPAGWNTTAIVSAVPDTTHFSVPMAVDPGAYTSGGESRRTSNVIARYYSLVLEG